GKGTEIHIHLPIRAEEVPAASPLPRAERPGPQTCRVLVIEDNPDAAASLQMLLVLAGFETRVALTGQEGVDLAQEFQPEVVVCDIGLPGGMDGYTVARVLRQASGGEERYLIALTGYGQEQDKQQAQQAGFDEHLIKPVD